MQGGLLANEAVVPQTRKVLLRSAMTMSPDRGSVFDVLLGLVRWGLGGASGDGRQFVSWIHDHDFIRAVYWLIDHDELSGPVNLAAHLCDYARDASLRILLCNATEEASRPQFPAGYRLQPFSVPKSQAFEVRSDENVARSTGSKT